MFANLNLTLSLVKWLKQMKKKLKSYRQQSYIENASCEWKIARLINELEYHFKN